MHKNLKKSNAGDVFAIPLAKKDKKKKTNDVVCFRQVQQSS
jgi:hypothetical protein